MVMVPSEDKTVDAVKVLMSACYLRAEAAGWWDEYDSLDEKGKLLWTGSKLMLVVTEVSEAMEGLRKGLKDDHLPQHDMFTVELADAVIRIMDMAGGLGLDLDKALMDKLIYNENRADHKPENRAQDGGKKI